MARPKIYDYDAPYDEIENLSVEGFRIHQVSFLPQKNMAIITFEEGYIDGDEIVPTRRIKQIDIDADGATMGDTVLDPQTFVSWYLANKDAFDAMHIIAMDKVISCLGKTGAVVY